MWASGGRTSVRASTRLSDALWRRRSLPAQQVRCSLSQLAQRLYGHAGHPDLCSLIIRTHLGSRATRWRVHAFSLLDEVIYVGMEELAEDDWWL